MITLTDDIVTPWLIWVVDWSLRWGILITLLALGFTVRPPRQTDVRYVLCWSVLVAGLLLPALPRWGSGFSRATSRGEQGATTATEPVVDLSAPGEPGESLPATEPTGSAVSAQPFQVQHCGPSDRACAGLAGRVGTGLDERAFCRLAAAVVGLATDCDPGSWHRLGCRA